MGIFPTEIEVVTQIPVGVLAGQIGDLTTEELRAFYAGCGLTPATGDPDVVEIVVAI